MTVNSVGNEGRVVGLLTYRSYPQNQSDRGEGVKATCCLRSGTKESVKSRRTELGRGTEKRRPARKPRNRRVCREGTAKVGAGDESLLKAAR